MADKVFNIIIKLLKQGGADSETVKGLVDIKNAMTAGIAIAGSVTAAYYAIDKGLQATVGELVKATTETEKFRNETGMTAEDSSRLLVVLKDLGISAGDVETAFKFAEKNGFEPTIASLEAMQAQYDALNPGMERTQFLVKEFGKGGLTLQKFFETGDIAARLEEVNKNLVISDATIGQVQKYKDEINDVSDTWEGLKLHAGTLTLPIVIKVLEEAANFASGGDLVKGLNQVQEKILRNSTSFADYQKQWLDFSNDPQVTIALLATGQDIANIGKDVTEANYELVKFEQTGHQVATSLLAARQAAVAYGTTLDTSLQLTDDELKQLQKDVEDQTSWETQYTNAKTAADRTDETLKWLGDQVQGLGAEGAQVWEGFLEATGQISPAAIAQFVQIEAEFDKVKKYLAAGISIDFVIQMMTIDLGSMNANAAAAAAVGGGGWTLANPTAVKGGAAAVYNNPNTGGYSATPGYQTNVSGHAAGGFIPMGGLGIVGDMPGRRTGYEELVQALPGGGAMVYSNQQANNMLGGGSSTAALEQAIAALGTKLNSIQNSLEALPSVLAAEIQKRR